MATLKRKKADGTWEYIEVVGADVDNRIKAVESKVTTYTEEVNTSLDKIEQQKGNLLLLKTTEKNNVVGAINEIKTDTDTLKENVWQKISGIELGVATTLVNITGLSEYSEIKLVGKNITEEKGAQRGLNLKFNNDSGNNYIYGNSNPAGFLSDTSRTKAIITNEITRSLTEKGSIDMIIRNYEGETQKKLEYSQVGTFFSVGGGSYYNANKIDTINLALNIVGNFGVGTIFEVYGR